MLFKTGMSLQFLKDKKVILSCAFLSSLVLSFLWFNGFPFETFMGDDLWLIREKDRGRYASSFLTSFSDSIISKYRPVFTVIFFFFSELFNSHWKYYIFLNILLHSMNGLFFSFIIFLLVKKDRFLLGFLAGVMMITSRFSYHYVFQLWGLMEELALFFLLAIIYLLVFIEKSEKKKNKLFLILFFFFLITFTHERFLFLFPFVSLVFYIFYPVDIFFKKIVYVALPLVVVWINFLIKTYVIGVNFFAGAGSHSSAVNEFEVKKIFSLMGNGFLNIFGFNNGPVHLNGTNLKELGLTGYFLGLSFFIPCFLAFVLYFKERKIEKRLTFYLFLFLLILLITSASVSVHLELRWIYSAFIVFLLSVFISLGSIDSNIKRRLILLVLFVCTIHSDLFYRNFLGKIYFVKSLYTAQSANDVIVKQYKREVANSQNSKIIIIDNGYQSIKNWTLLNDYFFEFYFGKKVCVIYVHDLLDIKERGLSNGENLYVFNVNDNLLFEDFTNIYNATYY